MRDAIVLGAGMVGVGTALALQERGWSVALVDRRGPGEGTSYGNAGLIQSEALEPYRMPRDASTLWAIASGRSNDVRYRAHALHHHLRPLLLYFRHSAPVPYRAISRAYASVIARAVDDHRRLIEAAGASALAKPGGYRVLHRDAVRFDRARADAERLRREFGLQSRALDPAELVAAEPALAAAEPMLRSSGAGAIHWPDTWSVQNPGALVKSYAELFRQRGGTVLTGDASSLGKAGRGWRVSTEGGPVEAEAAVLALGPWSPALLRGFGLNYPMVRKRGYHRHWTAPRSLSLPLLDTGHGYLMVPMAAGLRITTGAELSGPDGPPTPVQLRRAEAAARELVDLGEPVEAEPWLGTRPCMPDMLPVIGQAPGQPGLWLHFGHGHHGLTLGPTTGRLLTELMSGDSPSEAVEPFSPARFG